MRRLFATAGALALAIGASVSIAQDTPKPDTPKPDQAIDIEGLLNQSRGGRGGGGGNSSSNPSHYRDFNEVTQGAEKVDGLFTLHKKDEHLYAEIKPFQFDQELLLPITIARGMGKTGEPLTSDDEMVLVFHRAGDKVQLVRRNIYYKAQTGSPIDKAVKQGYTDSILLAMPIIALNPGGGMSVLVDFSDIFMTDFAQLGLGYMDKGRSSWHKVKGFPNNLEIEVEATYGGGRGGFNPRDGVADSRGVTVVLHYSLMKAPDRGYRPRVADDRLGHWISLTKEFGSNDPDTNITRYINRWRLEKADPRAKLSPPKKQIVWWIEDTVPHEYRPYVEAGILEWNKAFEKIGYRNAMTVRWQQPGEEFDPEDTNYCTFRWVTSDAGYARTCFRPNPMTGEIIDGDVIFDGDGFIRSWKQQYALLVAGGDDKEEQLSEALAVGEIISPILAAKRGFGQYLPTPDNIGDPTLAQSQLVPSNWGMLERKLQQRFRSRHTQSCQFMSGMSDELGLAALALASNGEDHEDDLEDIEEANDPLEAKLAAAVDEAAKKDDKDDKKEAKDDKKDDKAPKPSRKKIEVPEELIAQGIKEVVMHEVGHSIGLRHNFRASTMLKSDQLHDTAITHEKGLVGSVMDYAPINIAPKGVKQGDYFTTTIGPYDYWAIEYAYCTIDGNEAEGLKKLASRAPESDLTFATDEDSRENDDPYVNTWDLGSDPCKFAEDRIALASSLLKTLDEKVVSDGEGWGRNRRAFSTLLQQWGNGATLAVQFVGGQSVYRDHRGDKDAHDPIIPVPGAKQRQCLTFLTDNILSDKSFEFSPAMLRHLAGEHWRDWGTDHVGRGDFPLLAHILDIQRIVLGHCLNGATLTRIQNQELQADPNTDPLRMEEVFRALTDGIFSDLNVPPIPPDAKDPKPARTLKLSTIRRNLQREYLRRLGGLMVSGGGRASSAGDAFAFISFSGSSAPADARSLARLHMKEIADRIGKTLAENDLTIDDTTRAHLDESRAKILKVLDAPLTTSEP